MKSVAMGKFGRNDAEVALFEFVNLICQGFTGSFVIVNPILDLL